jgi:hypothetical protein
LRSAPARECLHGVSGSRQILSSLPAALLPEITCAGATIPLGARHGSYHAPSKEPQLFHVPAGSQSSSDIDAKTQPTPATPAQHADAAAAGTVAPHKMLRVVGTAKVQLLQPVSALPGRRNRGAHPSANQVLRIHRANLLTARECRRRWQHGATQDAWRGRHRQSPALATSVSPPWAAARCPVRRSPGPCSPRK